MKRPAIFISIVVAVAGTVAGIGSAATSSGGATPADTLKQEAVYLNARNWKPYYGLMGPRFRASCKYGTFVARNEYVRNQISRASIKMISTTVNGSRAYLSYETMAPPLKPFVTHGDLFVKIGGRWYDELDRVTTC